MSRPTGATPTCAQTIKSGDHVIAAARAEAAKRIFTNGGSAELPSLRWLGLSRNGDDPNAVPAAPAASAAPYDHAAVVCFHVFYSGEHAVIKAFYIHFEHAVEILLAVASSLPMWEMPAYFTRVDSATLGQQLKRGS